MLILIKDSKTIDPTGEIDCTDHFQRMLDKNHRVVLPPGIFRIEGELYSAPGVCYQLIGQKLATDDDIRTNLQTALVLPRGSSIFVGEGTWKIQDLICGLMLEWAQDRIKGKHMTGVHTENLAIVHCNGHTLGCVVGMHDSCPGCECKCHA